MSKSYVNSNIYERTGNVNYMFLKAVYICLTIDLRQTLGDEIKMLTDCK